MISLTCRWCNATEEADLGWRTFSNGTIHLEACCRVCGRHIKFAQQTPEALAAAPKRPE